MRFYSDVPSRRTATIARDALAIVLVLLFAWLGLKVHDAVDELASLGRGVQDAGQGVQRGFTSAANAVDDTPLIGGRLGDGLRDAGRGSGGEVAQAGRKGEAGVHDLANLLGVLTWGIPTLFLLSRLLPTRVEQVRRLSAASRVLAEPDTPGCRRTVAMRAAFSLPYGQLLRHTRDPLGDLEAERYDGLVAAAFDDAGLMAPAAGGARTTPPGGA